ncbi:MAG: tetratricopeptide (TPR) repeat protein [Pseudohongiellaceae bacterium]
MKPAINNTMVRFGFVAKTGFLCAVLSLLLWTTSSTHSQPIDLDADNALARSVLLQAKVLDMRAHEREFGENDPALIEVLVQLADRQSLSGEYENAISHLKEALQVSRINNGLYHYSQIDIVDDLIANETLMGNWEAVNSHYELEENLYRRLFGLTDARLEVGLEKVTAWHISAINQNLDDNAHEHLIKLKELLNIRLDIVENLLGNDNARHAFIVNTLEYVELELQKLQDAWLRKIQIGTPSPSPTKTNC